MKSLILIIALFAGAAVAQVAPSDSPSTTAIVAPVVAHAPVPIPPQIPAAPPEWVIKALTSIESLPTVGPIVSKAIQYLAIFGSLMTLLAGFVMGSIKLIGPLLAMGEGDKAAAKVQAWMDSSIVYWLKYVSFFNAKKPEENIKV